MPDEPLNPMRLPTEHSEETLYIKRMKEALVTAPKEKGDRMCVTFKLDYYTLVKFRAAVTKHGMTMTDILTFHINQIIPVLGKAEPIEVSGYKRDRRTRPPRPEWSKSLANAKARKLYRKDAAVRTSTKHP
jgi:antitoxin component of RelBE/YafQ-DinJ toxin-antitoxin module